MEIKQENVIDLLDQQHPALSSTNDMPVIETKPDASPEKEAEAAPEKAEQATESATVDTDEEPGVATDAKKPARGVQKRLDELTKQREDAKREADAERAEKLRLLALLEQRNAPVEPAKESREDEPVKPNKADFQTPEEWENALMEYAGKLATHEAQKVIQSSLEEQQRKLQQDTAQEKQRELHEAYSTRIETAKSKYADFSEVAERADVALPMAVVDAILTEEDGPELQYHFGKNPEEAKRLSEMTRTVFDPQQGRMVTVPDMKSQLMELGRITERLKSATPKPSISNAPPPLKPHKPSETLRPKDPSEESMDEYVARRNKERQAMRH